MIFDCKKKFFLPVVILLLVCSVSFGENIYSKPANWAYFSEGDGSVDLFLIAPTVDEKDEYNMSLSDDITMGNFLGALNMQRGIYEGSTRMYAPYYRQMSLKIYELPELSKVSRDKYFDIAYKDIYEAFAYYLNYENKGRPVILAGFSQGAEMCYKLLEDFFKDEELQSQLIAVYALGCPLDVEFVKKNPHIKPAQSEDDFGVVVAFDCEAPEITSTSLVPENMSAYAINPLNWKTDETFADKNLNLGACFTDYSGEIKSEIPNFCGAYLDTNRGVVKIPDLVSSDYPPVVKFLPDGAYHVYDYMFFFRNLQQNVKNRIQSFEKR